MSQFPVLNDYQVNRLSMVSTWEYFCRAVQNLIDGKCPFCDISTCKETPVKEVGEWFVKWNDFPQKEKTTKHLLVIPKRHIVDISEMTLDDWVHSGHLIQWVIAEFNIPGGGILTRFGNPFLNAGTVEHLHINIMEPNGKVEFRPPLAKEPAEVAEGIARFMIFKKLWLGASVASLSEKERKLIACRHPEVPNAGGWC